MTPNYQAGDRAQGTRQGNGYGSRNRATSPARRSSICVLSPTSASRSSRSRSRESFTKRRVRSTDHDPIGAIKIDASLDCVKSTPSAAASADSCSLTHHLPDSRRAAQIGQEPKIW